MQCVSGIILNLEEDAFQGYLCWEEGIITEVGKGTPPCEPEAKGLITPLFINGHTHIGDSAFSGKIDPNLGLREIVDPPGGLKHRLLAETPEDELISGITRSLRRMAHSGTGAFLDFREGGIKGIELLESSRDRFAKETGFTIPSPLILSRPSGPRYDRDEMHILLENSMGIGISALMDWEYSELEKVAAGAHKAGKLLALHASETVREDIDSILDLRPHILIHLTSATPSDLERVADAGVRVVLCPRANSLFGFLPDIPLMLKKGLSLTLGTDNIMFTTPDPFAEMDFAWRTGRYLVRKRGKAPTADDILRMAGHNIKKVLNVKSGICQGDRANFMALAHSRIEPAAAAQTLIRGGDISLIVDGESQWRLEYGII